MMKYQKIESFQALKYRKKKIVISKTIISYFIFFILILMFILTRSFIKSESYQGVVGSSEQISVIVEISKLKEFVKSKVLKIDFLEYNFEIVKVPDEIIEINGLYYKRINLVIEDFKESKFPNIVFSFSIETERKTLLDMLFSFWKGE